VTLVVDANIVAALALPVPYSPQAAARMTAWSEAQETLIAPTLFEYEIVSVIRRWVSSGGIEPALVSELLQELLDTRIITLAPTPDLHRQALAFAERIGQSKAYDGQYLALAARENAAFWTADRRLAAAAQQAGLTWVHWVGEESPSS
jgi:predicted nucleic acid-binding protein